MIKKQFSENARRARNMIWNAAGRYDFEPPFMAYFPNGTPDYYFDMMIGFAEKWLDMQRLWDFFKGYEKDRRAAEWDELLWLGLENALFEKEAPERPVLEELRKKRGERFYEEQARLSRQQMEYQSMPVYTQQEARWAAVCGKKLPLLTPRERRMAEALRFSGDLGTDEILAAMKAFLETFFKAGKLSADVSVHKGGKIASLFLRPEHRRKDRFLVRTGSGEGDHARAVSLGHKGLGRHTAPDEEDEAYVRAVFGRSLLSDEERRLLTNELCMEEDADCRLWMTRGEAVDESFPEAREIQEKRKKQEARNDAYVKENAAVIQNTVKSLSSGIETVLSTYMKHLPEASRAGRLCPEKAYRLPVLQDGRVFLKEGEETEQEFFVDLLLDASQSRLNSQEVLSAEAFIVARSLTAVHIPVRVTAFRSLRGYTILEELKFPTRSDCRGLLRYYAGGWNRDSLALEALGRLEDDPALRGKQRILLIMTDANPNDSTPAAAAGQFLPREYEGAVAVKEAEKAVRQLRNRGIRVGAIFHGNTSHLADLHQIYGHSCVRIRKASQLAEGVSELLLMMLREIRTD